MNFNTPLFIVLHLSAFAFALSLAVCGFMLSARLLDAPVARSNHISPIPTGAGIGIVAGLGAGLFALAMFYPRIGDHILIGQIAALAFAVALLGLFDDVFVLGSKIKFMLMVILASASVYIVGVPTGLPLIIGEISIPTWGGYIGGVLWIFVVMNAVNFMDGANGIMGACMGIAFTTLAVVSLAVGQMTPAIISIVMAASLLGFLPYNARNTALIFSGDIGSLLCGFIFATLSLLLANRASEFGLLYVGPLLMLPFLADILLTMALRASRKENMLNAHNNHLYQRLIKSGRSHLSVTMLYLLAGVFMSIVTMAGVYFSIIRSTFFVMLWVCVMTMIYLVMHTILNKPK